MLIQIDFYRNTGKWYSGGRVEISANPWEEWVLEDIIRKQDILVKNWWKHKSYFLIVSDIPESTKDPNYRMTYNRLYTPYEVYSTGKNL